MATPDFTNIGDVLQAFTNELELIRREYVQRSAVDGVSKSVDLIDSVLDLQSTPQSRMGTAARSTLQNGMASALQGVWNSFFAIFDANFPLMLEEQLPVSDIDVNAGPILFIYTNIDGAITITAKSGYMAILEKAMEDNGLQIKENSLTFGPLTEFGSPTGKIKTPITISGEHYTLSGTLKLTCTQDTTEAIQFTVEHIHNEEFINGATVVVGQNPLTLGTQWQDGNTGLNILALLDDTVVGNDPSSIITLPTQPAVLFPAESSTTKGKIYVRITRRPSDTWLVELFADAGLTSLQGSNSVATGTVGTQEITVQPWGAGQVVMTIDKAALDSLLPAVGDFYPTPPTSVYLDIRQPREGEIWQLDIENDEAGQLATVLAKIPQLRAPLPTGPIESGEFVESMSDPIEI